jgi:hypothetical protein
MNCYTNLKSTYSSPWGTTIETVVPMGVRQGDPLSPTLFIMFLNMFLNWVNSPTESGKYSPYKWNNTIKTLHSLTPAFADDLVFHTGSKAGMTKLVAAFETFLDYYGIRVNHVKSAYQHVFAPRDNENDRQDDIHIQGKLVPFQSPEYSYKYLGYLINLNLKWKDQQKAIVERSINQLNLISLLRFPANTTARIINATVFTITTACALVPLTKTDIQTIQRKAQSTLRKSLKYTNCIEEEFLTCLQNEGGSGLQSLSLEAALSTVRLIQQTINKDLGTGMQALIETLSAAIGLPHYNNSHLGKKATNGPYEFSPSWGHFPQHQINNYATVARRHHFYKYLTQALEDLRTLTATDWQFTFLPAMAPTATNIATSPLTSIPTDLTAKERVALSNDQVVNATTYSTKTE